MMEKMQLVQEGFTHLDKAVRLDPENPTVRFYWGIIGVSVPTFLGRLDQGVEHLEKAVEICEKDPDKVKPELLVSAYQYLAKGYELQKQPQQARVAWEKIIAISPKSTAAEEAREKLKEVKITEARPKPKEKSQEKPGELDSLLKLGEDQLEAGNYVAARETFTKAISLNPESSHAHFLLAMANVGDVEPGYDERIYEDQEFRTKGALGAMKHIERAVELDPENKELRLYRGIMSVQFPFFVGKLDQGIADLELVINDKSLPDSTRATAMYHLGFGYRKKALPLWIKVVTEYPNTEAAKQVFQEYVSRECMVDVSAFKKDKVVVTFQLGFQDEIPPQTAVWVEDAEGNFVRTLYVSGFSAFVKERQIQLPEWANASDFEPDATTGASIDWGKHTYLWDLTGHDKKRVKDGVYVIKVETHFWPSMQYQMASAKINVSKQPDEATVKKGNFIPFLKVEYLPQK